MVTHRAAGAEEFSNGSHKTRQALRSSIGLSKWRERLDPDAELLQIIESPLSPEERRAIRSNVRAMCIDIEAGVRAKMRAMPDLSEYQYASASDILAKIDKLRLAVEALEKLCP